MNPENIKSQLKKGLLEFFILNIIAEGKVYASDILQKLLAAKMLVVEGTLYPLLSRMRSDELVHYEWQESPSGPPRKYYSLTLKGKEKLQIILASWEEILESYNLLTQKHD